MGDEEKWWKAVRDEKKMKRSGGSDKKWKEKYYDFFGKYFCYANPYLTY